MWAHRVWKSVFQCLGQFGSASSTALIRVPPSLLTVTSVVYDFLKLLYSLFWNFTVIVAVNSPNSSVFTVHIYTAFTVETLQCLDPLRPNEILSCILYSFFLFFFVGVCVLYSWALQKKAALWLFDRALNQSKGLTLNLVPFEMNQKRNPRSQSMSRLNSCCTLEALMTWCLAFFFKWK